MVASDGNLQAELLQIELAIALDKGKSISDVANSFGVKISTVKAVSKKSKSIDLNIKKIKRRRFSEVEQTILVERIINGESIEEIAEELGITEITVRRWCKNHSVNVPRNINQISLAEQREIKELLDDNTQEEVAKAYNISRGAVEELMEPLHCMLDVEKLSFLFELLREIPHASDKMLCKIAKEAGLEIQERAAGSYKKRLKMLDLI